MNKKQTLIISALLLVVVLCGYAATQVNSPLYVTDGEFIGETATNDKDNKKKEKSKTTSSSSYFTEAKLSRDQARNKATQTLKSLLDNDKTPAEQKKEAAEEYKNLALRGDKETNIELALKAQGFEEVVCELEDEKANIVVKHEKELSDQQLRQIKDVVVSKANIKNVQIKVIE
ncbi:SpoIIIAH-like family protein [Clostridium sp. ATCC 25772]|uniref:SpoIIIAH-like family protein n=1 Tax=Clostridium sp. ATCC 25772 TaxID=1676991 RepID=UPI000784A030|nr:SpoIIIAH-like family protein [Clostridium sp. ATCC 25772]